MRRAFLSLYFTLIATVLMVLIGVPLILEMAFREPLVSSVSEFVETPRAVLERELADIPKEQWEAHIETLHQHFEYGLTLHKLADIKEESFVIKRLGRGEVTATLDDENDYAYIPLRGSDYIAKVYFSPTEEEQAGRGASGFLYLIEKRLALLSKNEHASYLQSLNNTGRMPVSVELYSDLVLTVAEHSRLDAGKIVVRDPNSDKETYFKRLSTTDELIKIGPLTEPFIARSGATLVLALFVMLFGIAAFLWLRPLWRDMLSLDTAAKLFGQGELNSSVNVSKRSPVRELADTFNAMTSRIRHLINAQKELTDSVSHELRTPITRLRFGMDRLDTCDDPGEWTHYKNGMKKDVQELDQLVDELLTYSRLGGVKPQLVIESADVQEWVTRIVATLQPGYPNVETSVSVGPNVSKWSIDRRLATRAVGNLLSNAMKYAKTEVRVIVEIDERALSIAVEDDGEGIPVAERDTIFEPFARVEASRSRETGGYGLGLAIVKRIAQWHRSTITVGESDLGGARFVMLLSDLTQIDENQRID